MRERGASLGKIATALFAAGHGTRNGKPWSSAQIKRVLEGAQRRTEAFDRMKATRLDDPAHEQVTADYAAAVDAVNDAVKARNTIEGA